MASSKNKVKLDDLKYSIIRVKTISFFVNEPIFSPEKEAKVELDQNFGISLTGELIDYRLRVYLFYLEDQPRQFLTEIIVQNAFKIDEFAKYFKEGSLLLSPNFVMSILNMSISHTRALWYQNLAGTVLQDYILPVTNAVSVAKVFYPQMFDKNGNILEKVEFKLNPVDILK